MSEMQHLGRWRAIPDLLEWTGQPRFIVCRDNFADFNSCEVYRLDDECPAAGFDTLAEAQAIAELLNAPVTQVTG